MGEEGVEVNSKISSLSETSGEPGGDGRGAGKAGWNSAMAVMVNL